MNEKYFPITRICSSDLSELSMTERHVLIGVANFSNNKTLETYITQQRLADWCGTTTRTIIRSISALLKKGFLRKINNDGRRNNKYILTMKGEEKDDNSRRERVSIKNKKSLQSSKEERFVKVSDRVKENILEGEERRILILDWTA